MTTPPPTPAALLADVERYLAALHRHAAVHDRLGEAFACEGCALLARIATATASHGPQERPAAPSAGQESPDGASGPQEGAQAGEWPDWTAISTYRHNATGRPAWAARCWGDGWVSLDHDTESRAHLALARHLREEHCPGHPASDPLAAAIKTQLSATPEQAAQAGQAIEEAARDALEDAGLRDRIAAAIGHLHDTGAIYAIEPGEIDRVADAVMAVARRWAEQTAAGRETARAQARAIEADRDRLAADLATATARAERAEAALDQIEADPEEPTITPAGRGCPHCPDGHTPPDHGQPWGAWLGAERDPDGRPITIHVARTDAAHVADSDAAWVRQRLNT